MLNQQQLLQMALQRCNNPAIKNIIKNANNPQEAIQTLCKQYPDIAKQIDGAIGQGQNPQQIAMNLLSRYK